MTLDGVADFEERRLDFRLGIMGYAEAYDQGIIDELGYEIGTEARTKTCRHCGRSGLTWGLTPKGWRLHDKRGTHVCLAFKPKTKRPATL